MADNVNLTAGDGTIVAGTDTIGGVAYPRAKSVWGPDGTVNDTDIASGKPFPIQMRSSTGTELTALDATTIGAVNETAPVSDTASSGLNGRLQRVAQNITTSIALSAAQASTTAGQTGPLVQGSVTTAAPTYVTAQTNPINLSTRGGVRIESSTAAHDAVITGNPHRIGGRALTANYTAVNTGDVADIITTLVGAQVMRPYSIPEGDWSYVAPSGGKTATGGVTMQAAAGAGLRNYVTSLQVSNSGAAGTEVQLKDGAAGTIIWRGFIGAATSGLNINFSSPIKTTAATLLELDLSSSTTVAVFVNAQGYIAP